MPRPLATACLLLLLSPPAMANVTLELWHSYRGAERAALEKTVADFNTRQAAIQIRASFIPYDAYLDKLSAAIPRGHGPDLFIAAHDRIGSWAEAGHLAPVDALLPAGTTERFLKQTVDPLRYRQQLYGLPLSFKSLVLYYNRDLVPVPPGDTQQLIDIARAVMREPTPDGQLRYGLAWEYPELYAHACWLFGFRGRLFDARGQLVLDSRENAASLAFVRLLITELGIAPADIDKIKITSLFNAGRAAMVINGPWFAGEIAPGIKYGIAVLPQIQPTGLRASPFLTAEAFMLSARSAHPQEAARAMDALTADAAARVRLLEGMQPVANHRLYDEPAALAIPALAVFREQSKTTVPMSSSPEMWVVWEPMKHAIVNVVSGRLSPEQALREAQLKASAQIEEFRKGQTLHAAAPGEPGAARAVAWGIGIGLLLALLLGLLFRRRLARGFGEAWRQRTAYGYIAPSLIAVLLLVLIPFAVGLGLSFFHYAQGTYSYVGLKNFGDILASREVPVTDPFSFYYKLFITVIWTAANVFIHLAVGLGLALLLKDPLLKCKGLYRVLLIIPWAIPNYITGIIWRGMFDADDGVVNHLLGLQGFSWWSSTGTAFLANLIANAWLGFPFMMVVALGALQSIPKELYEAAEVDGASRFQKFRTITLPLLKPALFPAIILGVIWTFNMFNIIYLVSRGAPNSSTDILVVEAFRWAFERGNNYGYAAAYSTLIFLILLGYSLITNRITKATEGAFD